MEQILSDNDIKELTGAAQSEHQQKVLKEAGIWFIKRKDGKIRTTWHHVNHPISSTSGTFDEMPNLKAI